MKDLPLPDIILPILVILIPVVLEAFLMIRRQPRSTPKPSSAASDVYKRQDDYQVLFTADIKKARIIQKASKATGIKITKIGKIVSGKDRSLIFNEKGEQIQAKSKGYIHQF